MSDCQLSLKNEKVGEETARLQAELDTGKTSCGNGSLAGQNRIPVWEAGCGWGYLSARNEGGEVAWHQLVQGITGKSWIVLLSHPGDMVLKKSLGSIQFTRI